MRFTAAVLFLGLVIGEARSAHAQVSRGKPNAAAPGTKATSRSQRGATQEIELSDDAELARVVGLYEAGKYAECAKEFSALLDANGRRPLRERQVIESARIYHAACLIGSGKPNAADEPLRAAIRDNMQMKPPDSLVFPPPVIERFLRVRQSLYTEIRKAEAERARKVREAAEKRIRSEQAERERVQELERLASREVLVTRNRRWIALVPFGVGQFQNGDEGLGWIFLTSEAVLGATALTALGVQTHFLVEATELRNEENNSVLRTWKTLLDVSSYSFLGVAALGIAQAQLAFVPEIREERPRPLPPKLRSPQAAIVVQPSFAVDPGGVQVGLSGRF